MDDYIEVQFNGHVNILNIVSPFASWDQPDPSYNIIRFYFDSDINTEGEGRSTQWYAAVESEFIGSEWHKPLPLWANVVSVGQDSGIFSTDAPEIPRNQPLFAGTCYSGNWSFWLNGDNPSDGVDDSLFATHG